MEFCRSLTSQGEVVSDKAELALRNRNPDVLTCIANLSNDEVFTPPELARQMLDLLADHWAAGNDGANIWANPDVRFLDPCSKSGVFLREITSRLISGLSPTIPDLHERIDHILTQQVFGISITRLTALLARRSVYCSKWANGKHSVSRAFDGPDGNIWFESTPHTWTGATEFVESADSHGKPVRKGVNGRCKFCGTSQRALDRESNLETHAYAFIHSDDIAKSISDWFGEDMQFDVIIGNPPYQLDDEGGHRPVPIYQKFVEQAKSLDPRFLVMVTPSRWMAGGLGLAEFRSTMLADTHIRTLVDYPVSSEMFPGVEVKGGVSYFLRDRDHPGTCRFTTVRGGAASEPVERHLDKHDILIRDSMGIPIVLRLQHKGERSFESLVASVRPFGDKLRSNFKDYKLKKSSKYQVPILLNIGGTRTEAWTKEEYVTANEDLVAAWKVFLPKAGSDGGQRIPNAVIGSPRIGSPKQVCTETFLAIGPFKTEREALNALTYLTSKFGRYIISLRKQTQDNVPSTFRWLPVQDWTKPSHMSDASLFKRYAVTSVEMAHIEKMITNWGRDD